MSIRFEDPNISDQSQISDAAGPHIVSVRQLGQIVFVETFADTILNRDLQRKAETWRCLIHEAEIKTVDPSLGKKEIRHRRNFFAAMEFAKGMEVTERNVREQFTLRQIRPAFAANIADSTQTGRN